MDELLNPTTADSPGGGSFSSVIDTIGKVGAAVGSTAGTLLQIQANRDGLIAAREDQQFQRYLRGAEMQVARDRVAIGSQVELLKAQGVLEQARAALTGGSIRWDYVLLTIAVVGGGFALVKLARGR